MHPKQQRQTKHKEMLESLKVGDKIITIGGIYGIIREIKGDIFTLEVCKDVRINTTRSAIGQKGEA